MVETIAGATDRRGIYVLDRGGDRSQLSLPLLARGLRFIIRLVGKRHGAALGMAMANSAAGWLGEPLKPAVRPAGR